MKLINIPFSAGNLGRNNGCEKAPALVCEALKNFTLNENLKETKFEILNVPVDQSNISKTNENIVNTITDAGDCIILGGDHSITYSCFKAFSKKHKNPALIVFDAHVDAVSNFSPPTHEDYLRVLVEEKILKPENIILVGVRNIDRIELDWLKQKNIRFFTMKQLEDAEDVCDGIMQTLREFDAVYLSLDIDILDPAFAPGTGCPEPGGLSTRELLYFLRRIKLLKNLRAVDLVEINPEKDRDNATVKLGAKIISELIV
ncbi:arginase family protein [Candidatus Woesearchaeota archaeon]|nr:arginase family protein [Candidatus Woesearchaeota archaeon]